MNPTLRNILAVLAGLIAGSIVNGTLISISGSVIPPPPGVDPSDMESLKAGIHLFEAKHFVFPFLAHALGTLAGALIASLIGVSKRMVLALVVSGLFLLGGIGAAFIIPAPAWFIALDLLAAYIPMALLGWKLSGRP